MAIVSTAGLNSEFLARLTRAIADAKEAGLNPGIRETWRSWQDQAAVLSTGASKADPGESPHQWGLAADVYVFGPDGSKIPLSGDPIWRKWGEIAMANGLRWGGTFTGFFDGPHVELPDWRESRGAAIPPVAGGWDEWKSVGAAALGSLANKPAAGVGLFAALGLILALYGASQLRGAR